MPIEIRELVIKATVENEEKSNAPTSRGSEGNENERSELINLCVEKILKILKEKSER